MFIEQEPNWKAGPPSGGQCVWYDRQRFHLPGHMALLAEGASAITRFYKHCPPAEGRDVTELGMLMPQKVSELGMLMPQKGVGRKRHCAF